MVDRIIEQAIVSDIPALETLVNSAYRGEASQQGWTTEAHLLKGDKRTDVAALAKLLNDPQAVILCCKGKDNVLYGCVYLRIQGDELYLGMLSVSPLLQGGGVGKQLIAAAEEYARQKQCAAIVMTVISVRQELIAWYQRLGYVLTGETQPFPTDERYGVPTQPLEFVVLRKSIM